MYDASSTGTASQAALAIALLRSSRWAARKRFWSHGGYLDDQSLIGLELDDVLLGADPRPPLVTDETKYRRWVRAQKEALRAQKEAQDQAARDRAALEEERGAYEERRRIDAEQRRAAAQAQIADRRAQWEAKRRGEALARERLVAERWSEQAADRARFEALFSDELLSDARQHGSVFDLCTLCHQPYWIQYDNLVNWSLYWKGPPRCYVCYAPPLIDRIRRDNQTWTSLRISHEIYMAISGAGSYAWAPELTSSRAWWIEHEHDYQQWIADA